MAEAMTQRRRLAAAIAGQPVDRLPVALWRHFYVQETSRAGLVEAMVRWQKMYDWDFLKINPRASYPVEDWGNRYDFSGREHVPPALVRACVHAAEDFRHLDRLDFAPPHLAPGEHTGGAAAGARGAREGPPCIHGGLNTAAHEGSPGGTRPAPVLADHLAAVADLRAALGPDVPMLMTVFTPMAIAAELAGGPQALAGLIAQDPPLVHVGLRTITDTFADFAARVVAAGADGIFLATTHTATLANFSAEQYQEFGRPYDLEVLAAVRAAPFNLLHVCKGRAMVRELADYPVAMINWDTADPTNPGLAEMAARAPGKALVGGLDRRLFTQPGGREAILEQAVAQATRDAAGRPFVLAATCTIDTTADPEAVRAVREFVGS